MIEVTEQEAEQHIRDGRPVVMKCDRGPFTGVREATFTTLKEWSERPTINIRADYFASNQS